MRAARMRSGWLAREAWKAWAVPWKVALMEVGKAIWRSAARIASTASPREKPGARLKERVTAGNWPWWLTAKGGRAGSEWGKAVRGAWAPGADLKQRGLVASGACPEPGATSGTAGDWLRR